MKISDAINWYRYLSYLKWKKSNWHFLPWVCVCDSKLHRRIHTSLKFSSYFCCSYFSKCSFFHFRFRLKFSAIEVRSIYKLNQFCAFVFFSLFSPIFSLYWFHVAFFLFVCICLQIKCIGSLKWEKNRIEQQRRKTDYVPLHFIHYSFEKMFSSSFSVHFFDIKTDTST